VRGRDRRGDETRRKDGPGRAGGTWRSDGTWRAGGRHENAASTRQGERGIHATRWEFGLALAAGQLLAQGR